jgi:hypothetical protein
VSSDRVDATVSQINESGGPPAGVSISRLQMFYDTDQRTAVVMQYFDTADAMAKSAQVFDAMDASDTPGTRASVDVCVLKLDISPSCSSGPHLARESIVGARPTMRWCSAEMTRRFPRGRGLRSRQLKAPGERRRRRSLDAQLEQDRDEHFLAEPLEGLL